MKNFHRNTIMFLAIVILIMAILLLSMTRQMVHAAPRSAPTNPGTTNMVGWWAMDETSGNRADSHSNGLTLTDNNTVTYATGKLGNAATFAAANTEYLSRSSEANLQMSTADIYFGVWVYTSCASTCTIAAKGNGTTKYEYILMLSADQKPAFFIYNASDGNAGVNWATSLTASTWYWVEAWTNKASSTIYINVNNGTPASATWTGARDNASTDPFLVGQRNSTNYYSGNIDDFVFYKRILTADERAWLYNSGSGRTYCDVAVCATATATATNTATATATNTATNTATSTATFTATATVPSATFTNTSTATATDTATATATVASATFTNTATATETFTPTVTYTPGGPTLTATATATPNSTQWFEHYWTVAENSSPNVSLIAILCIPLTLVPMAVFVLWLVFKKKS
jgi:hypothetical protein